LCACSKALCKTACMYRTLEGLAPAAILES
jgi:hypothetical protein